MCFHDVLESLRRAGIDVTQSQIRWAISSGKIARPPLDGSLRFDFSEEHVDQLRRLFATKVEETEKC